MTPSPSVKPSARAAVLASPSAAPAAPTTPAAAAAPAVETKKARKPRKIDPATGKPVVVSPEERRARALAKWARQNGLTAVVEFMPAETRAKIASSAFAALRGEAAAASLIKRAAKVREESADAVKALDGFKSRLLAVKAQVEEASRAALLKAAGIAEPTPASDGAAL